jgi:hypothetical protein
MLFNQPVHSRIAQLVRPASIMPGVANAASSVPREGMLAYAGRRFSIPVTAFGPEMHVHDDAINWPVLRYLNRRFTNPSGAIISEMAVRPVGRTASAYCLM